MAKRKSINRGLRRSPRHRSSDSMNSALLDPDTDIVGEGRTFWWNNLEESTPPRYSRLYSKNETAKQLNENSQIDSTQSPPEWWKNLETSNSKHAASTKHNFSAGIVKRNILQISTSESEKESERSLKKVQLKATKRKSINNAFLKALDDTETAVNTIETNSLNLSSPNIEKAMSNANEIVVSSHASDESIEMTSGKYLKPKSRFIQRARKSIGKNAFADVLADNSSSFVFDPNKENDNNEAPLMSRLASLSSSKRSINRSNNITNKSSPIHKSPRLSSDVTKRQSLDLQAGDDSNTDSSGSFLNNNKSRRKRLFEATALTPKSKLLQDSRKSVTKKPNLFEEILEENDNITARESNVSAEDNHASFKEDKSEIKIVDVRGAVEMEVSPPRDSRAASEEKSDDISLTSSSVAIQLLHVQAEGNVEANSSGSSLDNNKSRKKRFFEASSLTPKSRLSQNSRKSITKKPNLFEEILEENSNISARKSHIPIEDNHTSFKRDESIIRIANVSRSEEMEKSPQMKGNRTTNKNKSDDISLTLSSVEKQLLDVQTKDNVEADSSGSSLDNDESRRKRIFEAIHLKPKSRILESLHKNVNKESIEPNQFEEIFKEDSNISARKSHIPIEDNRTSSKRDGSVIMIANVRRSEEMEKSSQTKGNKTTSEEDSDDISLTLSSDQDKRSKSKELNVSFKHRNTQATNNNLANLSKSISQKNTVIKTPEKQASFSRKSTRKETLEEHAHTNTILPVGSTNINETIRHETASDHVHDDVDIERDLPKQMSKSSPMKELRVLLTRSLADNFPKNLSETPKTANVVREVVDNLHNNTNKDSSIPKKMSKSSPDKEARLTHNSSRNQFETPKRPSQDMHKRLLKSVGDIEDDVNVDSDINIGSVSQIMSSTRISKVGTNVGTRKSTGLRLEMESSNDEDAERARQTIQQNSTLLEAGTSSKTINRQNSNRTSIREGREIARKVETSLGTRKSISLRLEMESSDDEDAESARQTIQQDSTLMEAGTSSKTINQQSIQNSNGTSIREDREIARKVGTSVGTRKSTSLRLEMESSDDEDAEPARQTIQQDSTSVEAGTSSNTINQQSIQNSNGTSIREDREIARKVGTSVGTREGTSLRLEMESSDDEDAEPARQTIQQDSTLMEAGTSSKTINRQSIQNSNRTSIGEGREIARKVGTSVGTHKSTSLRLEMESSDDEDAEPARQTIQQDSTLMEAGTNSKTINQQSIQNSNRTSIREDREITRKQRSNLFKSLRKIDDFFKVKQTPTTLEQSNGRVQKSQVFEKMEKIKTELEKIKTREMAAMHIVTDKKKFPLKKKDMKSVQNLKATKVKPLVNHTKVVNKAFLVNGKVYRAPRLLRPKYWATDRLYKFLWNHMEPNYKLATRVKSEKFVQGLAKTVAIIERRKNYKTYKVEVNALMKEMARLNIINTRNDFYHFCQEFMLYEFRVKVVPMLMPGNKNNIPYNSELLHIPLLDVTHEE